MICSELWPEFNIKDSMKNLGYVCDVLLPEVQYILLNTYIHTYNLSTLASTTRWGLISMRGVKNVQGNIQRNYLQKNFFHLMIGNR